MSSHLVLTWAHTDRKLYVIECTLFTYSEEQYKANMHFISRGLFHEGMVMKKLVAMGSFKVVKCN